MRNQNLKLLGCLALFFIGAAQVNGADRPNIIFIMADDLGWGDLGSFGQKTIQTPNLDRMASQGARFTQVYAGSTVCAPSRCVLMTGLHTGHSRVRGNARFPLLPEDITVAEVLKPAGYRTGLVGKWGLGEPDTTGIPNRQGFDYFFGYLNQRHAHNYYPTYLWRNEERVDLPNVVPNEDAVGAGQASNKQVYSHDLFANEALEFIRKNRQGPFFLYLALTIPHANNEAGQEGMEVPELGDYPNRDWPEPQKGLAAMISRMDRDIGRLFDLLAELEIDQNTIVFFTSDNGPHREGGNDPGFFDSNGPLRGIKRDLYDGGIRVPTIVRWPGKIEPGTVNNAIWYFADFLPTAAALAGAGGPERLDGLNVLPAILGQEQPELDRRPLYWEFHERGFKQAIRRGAWKAVRNGPSAAVELYHMTADAGEQYDLASQYPDVADQLAQVMDTSRIPSPLFPTEEERAAKPR